MIYRIQSCKCGTKIFMTDNPTLAQIASNDGCYVTAVNENFMVL